MKRFATALIAAVLLLPAVADAYVPSPRYGAMELKFGPWRPNADEIPGDNPDTENVYSDYFGDSSSMFNTTLEVDWQFARVPEVISFGVGFGWGFMREEGTAPLENPSTDENGNEVESSDKTSINVMPLTLLAVFRLDVLPDKTGIPLMPFFKIGMNWMPWWSNPEGAKDSNGGTLGWQFSTGLAIQLDWIDRMSARTFDNETGVNHSYLFWEYVYAQVENFGAEGHLYLSPTNIGAHGTWWAGICVEF